MGLEKIVGIFWFFSIDPLHPTSSSTMNLGQAHKASCILLNSHAILEVRCVLSDARLVRIAPNLYLQFDSQNGGPWSDSSRMRHQCSGLKHTGVSQVLR